MFLLELVMQGVRGFKDLTRLRFQNGFNFIAAGNEAGKTASVDTLSRLLFPDGRPGPITSLVSRYTPDASRAALVVCANDGAYYRVIQDFSKQGVNLSRYNAATKEFSLMHKDWESAAQFMAGLAAGMSEDDFAKVFMFKREHYTSLASAHHTPASAAPRILPDRPAAPSGGKTSAHESRLAELREELSKAEEAGNAEYQLQAAKIKLDDLAKKLQEMEEINARYSELEANITALKGCETLPENLAELLREHEKRQDQKMAKLDELQQDMDGLAFQMEGLKDTPLLMDKLFLIGAFVGIASFIAGLFILTAEQADYFPIGILASVALIAMAWYKTSRKNAQKKLLQKHLEELQSEAAEVEKSFEEGGGVIAACMQATGATTVAELRDKASNYKYFRTLLDDVYAQRERLLGGVSQEALLAEYHGQQQEVIELGKAAAAVSQYAVDAYSIRQEIERLEAESAGASVDFGMWGGGDPAVDFPAPAADAGHGIVLPELNIACRIGGIEMETLVPAVQAAAQRNFSSITLGRYVRVEMGTEGDLAVYDEGDEKTSFPDLSHGTRELLYFCLRTGLVEAVAGKVRLPFILDDPLAGFDPARQRAACQVLRTLGAKAQVILFTSNSSLRAEGDAAAELIR